MVALACGVLPACSALGQADYATPYTFATLAGNEPQGSDGTGAGARFSAPEGVAVDNSGNVYVADTENNTIRKVTPAGVVTTFAGREGPGGSADGTGAAAQFQTPYGIAIDGSGNLYVADSGNDTIRKITPAGVVTTFAGDPGVTGAADGNGTAAQFTSPEGIAVDAAGNLYVADTWNAMIRRITPAGDVTTLAGSFVPPNPVLGLNPDYSFGGYADGTGSAALFSQPGGIAVDGTGNVFVADSGNNVIREVTPAGVVTTIAGTHDVVGSSDGTGGAAQFNFPAGIAVDGSGNLYVADTGQDTDTGGNAIRRIAPTQVSGGTSWVVTTIAAPGSENLGGPAGLALEGAGVICVADSFNNTIDEVSAGGTVTVLAGGHPQTGDLDGTGTAAEFDKPYGVAVDSLGNAYVADTYNNAIREVTPAGVVTTLAGGVDAGFKRPEGVAVDGAGNVYVADSGNNAIRKVAPGGAVTTLAGKVPPMGSPNSTAGSADGTGSAAQFDGPAGIAVDRAGNLYVADTNNFEVRKVTPSGVVTTLAGLAGNIGGVDGTGSAARFYQPTGVAVDGAGNIYVADAFLIRKVTPAGVVTTPAGSAFINGSVDGTGPSAGFIDAAAVAVDGAGNVYVADEGANTIRMVTPAGVVTTLAGTPAPPPVISADARATRVQGLAFGASGTVHRAAAISQGSADGTGVGAQFNLPSGIAIDGGGNLYVADMNNSSIRRGTPPQEPQITTQPVSQTVVPGATVVFTVTAGGAVQTSSLARAAGISAAVAAGATYQWQFNGVNLIDGGGVTGSTGPQLEIKGATAAYDGSYDCIVTTTAGAAVSSYASLSVGAVSNPGYLVNFSARGLVGTGDGILIGGFYVTGSTSRSVLVQALGPALAGEGVSGVLQHPALTIHDSTGAVIYSNTGWGSSQVLRNAASSVYANPPLEAGSADSEALLTLAPGGYTAEVSGADGGTGIALCAVYELP